MLLARMPFALIMLAAVIYNMFAFHITMQLIGVVAPFILTILWVIVAQQHRSVLLPLLAEKTAQ
jgi:hypothetical protein